MEKTCTPHTERTQGFKPTEPPWCSIKYKTVYPQECSFLESVTYKVNKECTDQTGVTNKWSKQGHLIITFFVTTQGT